MSLMSVRGQLNSIRNEFVLFLTVIQFLNVKETISMLTNILVVYASIFGVLLNVAICFPTPRFFLRLFVSIVVVVLLLLLLLSFRGLLLHFQ